MELTIEERYEMDRKVRLHGKSKGVAYVLWLFLGLFFAHRFYLGHIRSAMIGLVLLFGGAIIFWGGLFWGEAGSEYFSCMSEHSRSYQQACDAQTANMVAALFSFPKGVIVFLGGLMNVSGYMWFFADLFLIPGKVHRYNDALRDDYIRSLKQSKGMPLFGS